MPTALYAKICSNKDLPKASMLKQFKSLQQTLWADCAVTNDAI